MTSARRLTLICGLASMLGFLFAAVSTSDFVAHLDRQVHGIHCSFLPGLTEADQSGESGCHTTLMSPYSSVFRSTLWGGIPISLPAMAVFGFLGFWAFWMAFNDRDRDARTAGFLALGSLVPLGATIAMGYLSLVELDAVCKLCIGIYASSCVLSISALVLWLKARRAAQTEDPGARQRSAPLALPTLGLAFATGVASVAISVGAYAATAPDFSRYVGSCGKLPNGTLRKDVLVDIGPQTGRPLMIEVLDPLCPSCRGFEDRLAKMDASRQVDRKVLLFPLDETCNWMIDRSIHPGACSISKAVLCSSSPEEVIAWAFEHQQEIIDASAHDPGAAANLAKARFPDLAQCMGSATADARLNQSLREAVRNRLQVLTPQVFVQGVRLCGEDTDLGLDFALPRLIDMVRNQSFEMDESTAPPSLERPLRPDRAEAQRSEPRPATTTDPDRRQALAAQLEASARELDEPGETAPPPTTPVDSEGPQADPEAGAPTDQAEPSSPSEPQVKPKEPPGRTKGTPPEPGKQQPPEAAPQEEGSDPK